MNKQLKSKPSIPKQAVRQFRTNKVDKGGIKQ